MINVGAGLSLPIVAGQTPGLGDMTGSRSADQMSKNAAKKESVTTRLAAGEAPWDMLSLKAAIHAAVPGAHPALLPPLLGCCGLPITTSWHAWPQSMQLASDWTG